MPCCVFANEFPWRVGAEGEAVRSYEQFIAYLAAKAPGRIRQSRLDFGGRNIVLYTLPDDFETAPCQVKLAKAIKGTR